MIRRDFLATTGALALSPSLLPTTTARTFDEFLESTIAQMPGDRDGLTLSRVMRRIYSPESPLRQLFSCREGNAMPARAESSVTWKDHQDEENVHFFPDLLGKEVMSELLESGFLAARERAPRHRCRESAVEDAIDWAVSEVDADCVVGHWLETYKLRLRQRRDYYCHISNRIVCFGDPSCRFLALSFPPREILVGSARDISCTVGGPLEITKLVVSASYGPIFNGIRHATRFHVENPDKFRLLHWD